MVANRKEEKAKDKAVGTPAAKVHEVAGLQVATQAPRSREEGSTPMVQDQRAKTAPTALRQRELEFTQEKVRKLSESGALKVINPARQAEIMRRLTNQVRKKRVKGPESTPEETPKRMLQNLHRLRCLMWPWAGCWPC